MVFERASFGTNSNNIYLRLHFSEMIRLYVYLAQFYWRTIFKCINLDRVRFRESSCGDGVILMTSYLDFVTGNDEVKSGG